MTCHPDPALREKNLLLVAVEGPAATLVPQRSLRPQPKIGFSLPIADCRLTIEKVVWQLLPMSISNRQSKSAIPAILGQAMIVENLRRT